jgi:3,4-dihydroxy 2-butanone 4-phosphate synthase / GTP cyclohydrolase II
MIGSMASVPEALAEIAEGRMIVVVDDAERENEGDLVMAAQFITPGSINFMATAARGMICLALTEQRCQALGLDLVASGDESEHATNFTLSIDGRGAPELGASSSMRARTIRLAIDPSSSAADLVQPGSVFPLRGRPGGVLERSGHTEASIDLARLAGCIPAGVICEIMNEDGSMARMPELLDFCRLHGLKLISVADLIAHRRQHERLVERVVEVALPTPHGEFRAVGYRSLLDDSQHLALVKGDVAGQENVIVRVHSSCLTGDVFGSQRCDCGAQLEAALAMIERQGSGVLLYLAQEGRGIGLLNKLRAYKLQEEGLDTVEANVELGLPVDLREYGIGAQILTDLGLSSIRLLTNNPKKIVGLEGHNLSIAEQIPIEGEVGDHNHSYLQTKRDRLGHLLGDL